jgi:hypothetical protein
MADRQCGSFTPSPLFEPPIALSQVRSGTTYSMSRLDQCGSHIAIAVRTAPTEPFARAFFVTRAVG